MMQIQPRARASSPAFASPIVPLRVSIPAEVFDLVASFVDLRTRSVLSRVDFAWFVRFHPLAKSSLWTLRKGVDRRRLVSLLSRDVSSPKSVVCMRRHADADWLLSYLPRDLFQPTVSPRLESRLSLRNVTVLSVFSSLIEDDAFPELSLDKLGLGGSPVRLQRLEIVLIFDKQFYPAWSVTRALRLSPQFLLLLDPAQLLVRERASTGLPPPPVRLFGGSRTDYYSQRATLDSVQVNRAAADAMCSWTRLGEVHLIDLDLHITQDDQQTNNTTAHAFFLHLPVLPSIPSTSVWWLLKRKPGFPSNDSGPQVLATPIRYLAARQPLEPTRIKRAYLVLPEEKERLVEKARTDVPALIKIIAAIGEEEEA